MKTMNYVILALALAPCGGLFGAEMSQVEKRLIEKLRKEAACSPEEKEKKARAIEKMHSATTEAEFKAACAEGACINDLLRQESGVFSTVMCSVALNPKAHDDLIPTVASMGGLTEWGTMKVAKDKNGVRRDITPIFFVLQYQVDRSDYQQNSLDLLQRKCVGLVDVGCPLASCWRWTISAHDARCPVQAHAWGTFADRVMPELSSMRRITADPFLYKGRFMHTLAMCKATHDAAVKRSAELGCILSDTLPMFSLDIINFLIFPYVQAGELAEIAKLHAFITNHQVLPYLSELEQETKTKAEAASAS